MSPIQRIWVLAKRGGFTPFQCKKDPCPQARWNSCARTGTRPATLRVVVLGSLWIGYEAVIRLGIPRNVI